MDDFSLLSLPRRRGAAPRQIPRVERYDFLREIGAGGMGVVYEVFDKRRRLGLALKTFPSRPEGVARFKREFRAVAHLRHPNLVRLYDLGAADDTLYYTMELLRGMDPRDYLGVTATARDTAFDSADEEQAVDGRAWPEFLLDPRPLAALLAKIAGALQFLHTHGVVHRDLKPDNILVDTQGEPTLLDFGLVLESDDKSKDLEGMVGTPAYMAPEQMMGEAMGPPTDMYALGVFLFECLTARLPFLGRNTLELLALRISSEAPAPSSLTAQVPPALEELCVRLLSKDPARRPTAAQVVEELEHAYGARARRGRASAARLPLVGRVSHKESLRATAGRGRGIVLWPGAAGVGKSRLLREARGWLEEQGYLCLTGRCLLEEALPFRAFDRAIDVLAAHLSTQTEEEINALGIEIGPLVRLFPALAELPTLRRWRAQDPNADPLQERRRAFRALRSLLAARAKDAPVALLLDDLHHADEGSLRLLEALCLPEEAQPGPRRRHNSGFGLEDLLPTTPRVEGPPALFLLSWRPEEAPPSLVELVERFPSAPHPILPLTTSEATQLLESVTAPQRLPEPILRGMLREAAGSPRWCVELGRSFTEGGGPEGYTIGALLRRQVSALAPERQQVLAAVVLGGRITFRVLAQATRLPEERLARELDELLWSGLVRATQDRTGDTYEGGDAAIDGALHALLSAEQRRDLHRALGEALAAEGASPALIAAQFAAAGEASRAAPLALTAARNQRAALAFEHAAEAYRLALRLGLSPQEAESAREELASVLSSYGRHDEASREWKALATARQGLPRAVTTLRAAEADLNRGALQEAMAGFEEVVVSCDGPGASLQKSRGRVLASIAWGYIESEARLLLKRLSSVGEMSLEDGLRLELYILLAGHLTAFVPERAVEYGARYLAMAIKSGDPTHTAMALEIAAMHMCLVGTGPSLKLAATYHQNAQALLPQIQDDRFFARRALVRGVAANGRGDFHEAVRWLDEATARIQALGLGPNVEAVSACVYAATPLLWLGQAAEAEERCARLLYEARARQNRYAMADLSAPIVSARLQLGDLGGAQRALSEAPREFYDGIPTLPKVHLRRAEVELLLAQQDPSRAALRFDECSHEGAAIINAPAWLRVEMAQTGLRVALALLLARDPRALSRARSLEKQATEAASPARLARSLRYLAELDRRAQNPASARLRLSAAEASLQRQAAPRERAALLALLASLDSARRPEAERAHLAIETSYPTENTLGLW